MSETSVSIGRFQLLVSLFASSTATLWVMPFLVSAPSEEAATAVVRYDGFDALVFLDGALYWSLLLLWLMATVALGLCWRNAREAFVALTIASVVLGYLSGTRVSFALDGALAHVCSLLNGAVIAMAYGSGISAQFAPRPRPQREPA